MIGRDHRYSPLVISEKAAQAVMGMKQVGAEITDDLPQFRNLTEISRDTLPVHTEIPAFDTLLLNRVHLLRDKRSITAFLGAGNNQDFHEHIQDIRTALGCPV